MNGKTAPQIARERGVQEHHVRYIVEKLKLKPAAVISNRIRLFSAAAERRIIDELAAIHSRRAG